MKKFSSGLLVGVLLSISIWLLLERDTDFESTTQVAQRINIQSKPSIQPFELAKERAVTERKIEQNVPNTKEKELAAASLDQPVSIQNKRTSKEKIVAMLDDFQLDELSHIEKMLKHWNDKTPAEYFKTEPTDSNWSLEKQAELEYTFYEQSALKDLGSLESIRCKSRTCQVKVKIPSDTELKPSHYLDWSRPISVAINKSSDGLEFKTVEIYISREQ